MPEQVVVSIRQAADMYGVGTAVITSAIHAVEGPHLRAKRRNGRGREYLIHVDDLKTWWDSLPDA